MEKKNGNDFQRMLDELIQSLQDFGDRVNDLFEPIRESIREFWETFSEKWPWIFSNLVLEAIEQGDYEFIENFVRNGLWIKPSLHESKTRYNSLSIMQKGNSGSDRKCSRCGSHDINIHQIGYWWSGDTIKAVCMDCGFRGNWGSSHASGLPGAVEGHSVIMEAALLTWATQDQWRTKNHPLKYIRKIVKTNSTWQDFDVDRNTEGKRYPGSLFHGWGNHKKEPRNCISYDLMTDFGERWIETDREYWLRDEQEEFTQKCYEPQNNPEKPLRGYELVFERSQDIGVTNPALIRDDLGSHPDLDSHPEEKNKKVHKNNVKALNKAAELIQSKFMFEGWHGSNSRFSPVKSGAYYLTIFTINDERAGYIYSHYYYRGRPKYKGLTGSYGLFEDDLVSRIDTERAILRAGLRRDDVEVALVWDCKPEKKGKLTFALMHLSRCICYGGAPPEYNYCGNMVVVDKKWTKNRVNASMQRIKRAIKQGRLRKSTIEESCLTIKEKVLRKLSKWPWIHYQNGRFMVESLRPGEVINDLPQYPKIQCFFNEPEGFKAGGQIPNLHLLKWCERFPNRYYKWMQNKSVILKYCETQKRFVPDIDVFCILLK